MWWPRKIRWKYITFLQALCHCLFYNNKLFTPQINVVNLSVLLQPYLITLKTMKEWNIHHPFWRGWASDSDFCLFCTVFNLPQFSGIWHTAWDTRCFVCLQLILQSQLHPQGRFWVYQSTPASDVTEPVCPRWKM